MQSASSAKVSRHLADEASCELELSVEHNPKIAESQVVEATVWTKGPVLRVRESSSDMYVSIDQVAERLERQVKRYRNRRSRSAAPPRVPTPSSPCAPSSCQIHQTRSPL